VKRDEAAMTALDVLSEEALRFLRAARVGHLATASRDGEPSVVPICFALDTEESKPRVYSILDAKPKRVEPGRLRRVRNLAENPAAALVVDRWDEDWASLGWVLLRGRGELLDPGEPHRRGLELLRAKYAQYRGMPLERALMIRLTIESHRVWGELSRPQYPA
jgi:PPOX class probable F420-dependent enzyme